MKKVNEWLKGFRTILTVWAGYLVLYADFLIGGLTGFSKEALKGAAVTAFLVTIKQIKTDVIPKLKGRLAK